MKLLSIIIMLDNHIILSGDNPNIAEILDYIREYYIRHEDYNIIFNWTVDNGKIGAITGVSLMLYTTEMQEDGDLAYLIAEYKT